MATYKSFKRLNGKTLKHGDILIFGNFKCEVSTKWGDRIYYSSSIFELYNIPLSILDKAYGKRRVERLQWKSHAPEALTRVALLIFAVIEESEWIQLKIKGKWVKIDLSKYGELKDKVVLGDRVYSLGRANGLYYGTKPVVHMNCIREANTILEKKREFITSKLFHRNIDGYRLHYLYKGNQFRLGCQIITRHQIQRCLAKHKALYGDQ